METLLYYSQLVYKKTYKRRHKQDSNTIRIYSGAVQREYMFGILSNRPAVYQARFCLVENYVVEKKERERERMIC